MTKVNVKVTSWRMPDTLRYDYDLLLSHVGDFGGFQKRVLFLLSLVSAVGGLAVVVFPFAAFVPRYRSGRIHPGYVKC